VAESEDEPIAEQQPDQAALAVVARHALHDEELIAAFAGGDLEAGEEADRARALTERCSACRDLYQDVQLIDNLIRAADTAADYGARVRAPRAFRLTDDDARRLGGPVPVVGASAGGIREGIRTALRGFARPLGASMATLGVVGLLVGSTTFGSGGMPLAADNGAPTRVPTAEELGPVAPLASSGAAYAGSDPSEVPRDGLTGGARSSTFIGSVSAATVLQMGSLAFLLAGLALLVIGLRGRGRRRE
jgi:hypothetical protein